ncbi:molecular chaperone TorD family protein [Helicobacter burdigaliensis]|uniref:molecular chaperone TorD family protein n=1 Tax=Helicobacter burdigaliensis TaxID=2315334 RepID=UPI000EF712A2|nr:molecular chaperone TorD family protein [Helicobacter burdigaliensis]
MLENLSAQELQDLKNARVLYYDFFYGLFVFELLDEREELIKKQISLLKTSPLSPEGEENFALLEKMLQDNYKALKEEYSSLFALPFGAKQVGIHLSHFYENCVGGESLLKMRSFIRESDIRVQTQTFKETEEHIGFIFGFLKDLLQKDNDKLAKEVFMYAKVAMFKLISEIQERKDSKIYATISYLLEDFLKFEENIFA